LIVPEIRTVSFVGAGTMGCANSLVAAVSGYDVVIHDAKPEGLDAVPARHDEVGAFLVQSGYCTPGELAVGIGRVTIDADLASAVANADLVSESVFEDLDVKRDVHRVLDRLAPARAILTTNSSMLVPSDIEGVVERGERFAALHSHLGSLLFDIVGGPRTSPETIDVLRRYVLSLGGEPLVLDKENRGYVFNAMNGPLLATAMQLVVHGRATTDDVDRAWMTERGAPMGPFGMMDFFGLDLIIGGWRKESDDPAREALRPLIEPLLAGYVDDGKFGMKSGHGFYEYPSPAYQDAAFLTAVAVDRPIADALTMTLIAAAVSLAANDVASPADIDRAWTSATGLAPGPFGMLDELGPGRLDAMLEAHVGLGLITDADASELAAFVR
jgi:3-hydroxybutyryl-CoA dehydrogenase